MPYLTDSKVRVAESFGVDWNSEYNTYELRTEFINVLIGQMSVIGPRPHMQYEDESLSRQIPKYPVRRFVKPGISGWAQVHGYRGGTNSLEDMIKRTEYDIDYIENWTFWLDIKIIFLTIWQMITFRIPSAY